MAAPSYQDSPSSVPEVARSDVESDSSDDEKRAARTSEDVRRHDYDTITAEEEAERLITGDHRREGGKLASIFRTDGNRKIAGKKTRRRGRDSRWRRSRGEETSELMYKAEEGGRYSSAENSGNSSEVDLTAERPAERKSILSRFKRFAAIQIVIAVAFLAFGYGAFRASRPSSSSESSYVAQTLSNGTHEFAPTTIVISLDGFRADFLHRGLTPTLSSFIRQGVSPKFMTPSFPSLTFPNHFTLVTGLYPESHGIVGNTFWDPVMQKEFYYTDPNRSMKPEFWNAEPIWETAELSGIRTAIHMWPGSEAHIGSVEPAYVDRFKAEEKLDLKVDRILGWLDLPGPTDAGASDATPRPQLIAAYVPNVDSDGHLYGPNSTYIRSTISEVDGMLGSIFTGLEERNLTQVVNVIVVSDHGMATTSNHRLIQLEDLVDSSLLEHIDGWPLFGLRPKDRSETKLIEMYNDLSAKAHSRDHQGKFDVYMRDQNMPERYHFSNNERIAPLWIVPKAGWAITPKHEFDLSVAPGRGDIYAPRGLHGYDHEHPLMRAIFVARGPAFPHPKGSRVEPFQNIELYNIICDSLGLDVKPNNGTIRLPFKTNGLHDFQDQEVIPDDPPPIAHVDASIVLPPTIPVSGSIDSNPDRPEGQGNGEEEEEAVDGTLDEHPGSWREWIEAKIQDVKSWAASLLGGAKGKETADAGQAA